MAKGLSAHKRGAISLAILFCGPSRKSCMAMQCSGHHIEGNAAVVSDDEKRWRPGGGSYHPRLLPQFSARPSHAAQFLWISDQKFCNSIVGRNVDRRVFVFHTVPDSKGLCSTGLYGIDSFWSPPALVRDHDFEAISGGPGRFIGPCIPALLVPCQFRSKRCRRPANGRKIIGHYEPLTAWKWRSKQASTTAETA